MSAETPPIRLPVLVVDDDTSLRTMLSLSLRRAGYPTLTAASGDEAAPVLTSMITPVVLINAVGLILLSTSARLSRQLDRLRRQGPLAGSLRHTSAPPGQ
jgi:CheY-like chemotaxis protein